MPDGVEKVRLRSDTAGHQHELLRYCAKGEHARFGRLEFAIRSDVTEAVWKAVLEVADADWQPIYWKFDDQWVKRHQEWTEVCYISAEITCRKNASVYRYLAIREVMGSIVLPGMDSPQQSFPFPTLQVNSQGYKVFGLVTNMDWEVEKLIRWHRERCGKSEEAHSVMKEDFAACNLALSGFIIPFMRLWSPTAYERYAH